MSARREAGQLFERTIEVARCQGARLFELQAVMRLCRLRRNAGSRRTLRRELAELYESLTEGRSTPALSEAKALLDAIKHGPLNVSALQPLQKRTRPGGIRQ